MADPFALNEDGTARDPAAFREALRADPVKMEALEKEPEVAAVVLGEDEHAFQELIKSVYQAEKKRTDRLNKGMAERTIDAQRVTATVPRDTVQLYQQLWESGLQYGPAFRLLRNVHVPDMQPSA
ncbi:DNA damage-inducible 1-like [Micractinium conductrix]|uniref:DNA damage-inducible 1-like n=1 Tax=Micractinium conductrix TaxID=554055 RepID=A0A2P6VJ31_9CHLO|nr:DNA damage-inducible 1-like [Micractinium conductrix]|eukprot:PSC74084.1 DNA damage-inducible 1-like [Micractinium conductrix]